MENKTVKEAAPSMMHQAASGGLMLGGVFVLIAVFDYVLGFYGKNIWLSVLNYLVMLLGIVYFTIQYRDKVKGGFISYGNSVVFGMLLSAFSAVLSGAFLYVLVTVIDPGYLEKQLNVVMETMMQDGKLPESQVDLVEKTMRMVMNPVFLLFSSVFGGVLIGLLISLVTSIFTKKEKSVFS